MLVPATFGRARSSRRPLDEAQVLDRKLATQPAKVQRHGHAKAPRRKVGVDRRKRDAIRRHPPLSVELDDLHVLGSLQPRAPRARIAPATHRHQTTVPRLPHQRPTRRGTTQPRPGRLIPRLGRERPGQVRCVAPNGNWSDSSVRPRTAALSRRRRHGVANPCWAPDFGSRLLPNCARYGRRVPLAPCRHLHHHAAKYSGGAGDLYADAVPCANRIVVGETGFEPATARPPARRVP
jgi:hypothetical protein